MNKIPSEIVEIQLSTATFESNKVSISPSFVNFFFGNNGTGKSTIANTIYNGNTTHYVNGNSSNDYQFFVFNQEFITKNLKFEALDAVFTLNKQNIEVEEEIVSLEKKIQTAQEQLNKLNQENENIASNIQKIKSETQDICWVRTKEFREQFDKALDGCKKKANLFLELLETTSKQYSESDILTLYTPAYSTEEKEFQSISFPYKKDILDTLEGISLLEKPIINSSNTELSTFLKTIGAAEWAYKGHQSYAHQTNGKCPYCSQTLPLQFEENFIKSFDESYTNEVQLLNDLLTSYQGKSDNLLEKLILPSILPTIIKTDEYTVTLTQLQTIIRENIDTIKGKIQSPQNKCEYKSTEVLISKLLTLINDFNSIINNHNEAIKEKKLTQQNCRKMILENLSFLCSSDISKYKNKKKELVRTKDNIESEIKKLNSQVTDFTQKLKNLRLQTVETESAKENINERLRDAGMLGFKLHSKNGADNKYEVQRQNGELAKDLSEGEKNLIAFLYFYELVMGNKQKDGDIRPKIVVIDDPVSSMDNNSIFLVGRLIHNIIEICLNNVNNRNSLNPNNFIKQVFIMTHNAYFHHEISKSYLSKYKYVNYYLVNKQNECSTVKLCTRINDTRPSEQENYNPVKNNYAALWEEYRELNSTIPLLNVMRRIIEYYFISLCGYEKHTIYDKIMSHVKNSKTTDGELSLQALDEAQVTKALITYLSTASSYIDDGHSFSEEHIDTQIYRSAFEKIFITMDQMQHYNMMMGIE